MRKMKVKFLFFIVLLLILCSCTHNPKKVIDSKSIFNTNLETEVPSRFSNTDICISEVFSDFTLKRYSFDELDKAYGKPISNIYTMLVDGTYRIAREYDGISFELIIGEDKNQEDCRISNVKLTSSDFCIIKDIVVGDSKEKVLASFFDDKGNTIFFEPDFKKDIQVIYRNEDYEDLILYNKYAIIIYDNNIPTILRYVSEDVVVLFYLENSIITKIEIFDSTVW